MQLFLNFHRSPVILLCVRQQYQSVAFAFLFDGRNVLHIEAAHVKEGLRFHALAVMADVIQQDIPVDVGEYDVERSECRNLFGSSKGDLDIVCIVEADVFERIVVGPFVYCRCPPRARLLFIRARMASTAVPHPMSSSSLPVRSSLSISLIIRKVVSWFPVPNAIFGSMMML